MEKSIHVENASQQIYHVSNGCCDYKSASVLVEYTGGKPRSIAIYSTSMFDSWNDMWRAPSQEITSVTTIKGKDADKLADLLHATCARELADRFANLFAPDGVNCDITKWLVDNGINCISGTY